MSLSSLNFSILIFGHFRTNLARFVRKSFHTGSTSMNNGLLASKQKEHSQDFKRRIPRTSQRRKKEIAPKERNTSRCRCVFEESASVLVQFFLFWVSEKRMRACISAKTMETDDTKSFKNLASDESDENETEESNFLRPFLSGWQRVWSNRKKWFGTGPEGGQEQPKSPSSSSGDSSGGATPDPDQAQLSVYKDPATALQTKYRRMSLKRTGVRSVDNLASRPVGQNTEDERPPSQIHTQVSMLLN